MKIIDDNRTVVTGRYQMIEYNEAKKGIKAKITSQTWDSQKKMTVAVEDTVFFFGEAYDCIKDVQNNAFVGVLCDGKRIVNKVIVNKGYLVLSKGKMLYAGVVEDACEEDKNFIVQINSRKIVFASPLSERLKKFRTLKGLPLAVVVVRDADTVRGESFEVWTLKNTDFKAPKRETYPEDLYISLGRYHNCPKRLSEFTVEDRYWISLVIRDTMPFTPQDEVQIKALASLPFV